MKETPILFTGPMVRAILDGTKTQTRRIVKNPEYMGCLTGDCPHQTQFACNLAITEWVEETSPYGNDGDRLWVKETFLLKNQKQVCAYRADMDPFEAAGFGAMYGGWKPSIFMPRKFSRITLDVLSVRVSRLQDISEEDSKAEGVAIDRGNAFHVAGNEGKWAHATARGCFETLWDSINRKKHPWKSNPWVWVITFQKITS